MPIKRRKILSDSRAENQNDAMQYAQKALRDSWLDAYVSSILTNHCWWLSKVFATGWRVKVISTIMPRASGDWVIYGRTLKLTRNEGKTTELRLRKFQEWMQPVQHVDLIKEAKPKKSKKQTTVRSKRGKS